MRERAREERDRIGFTLGKNYRPPKEGSILCITDQCPDLNLNLKRQQPFPASFLGPTLGPIQSPPLLLLLFLPSLSLASLFLSLCSHQSIFATAPSCEARGVSKSTVCTAVGLKQLERYGFEGERERERERDFRNCRLAAAAVKCSISQRRRDFPSIPHFSLSLSLSLFFALSLPL